MLPALRTWASVFKHVWVVMEDAPAARAVTQEPGCTVKSFTTSRNQQQHAQTTSPSDGGGGSGGSGGGGGRELLRVAEVLDKGGGKKLDRFCSGCIRGGSDDTLDYNLEYHCAEHPIILSNCSNGYWGTDGPCCKCEAAFRHLITVRPEVHAQIRWMVFSDDDMYFVPPTMMNFLSAHDSALPIVVSRGEVPTPHNNGECGVGRSGVGWCVWGWWVGVCVWVCVWGACRPATFVQLVF